MASGPVRLTRLGSKLSGAVSFRFEGEKNRARPISQAQFRKRIQPTRTDTALSQRNEITDLTYYGG
jgi:hypothetical protein